MIVAGVNLGSSKYHKPLRDGGVCIVMDGRVMFAVAEERVTRKKRAGGFEKSLNYALEKLGLSKDKINLIVYSTCCDAKHPEHAIEGLSGIKSIACDHHLSHALSVYFTSPFEEAIIAVLDAGGNLLDSDGDKWWQFRREQHSYYHAKGSEIRLLERDCDLPECAGVGEAYRAFTHYLGWHSSVYAGRTMALAPYGDPAKFEGKPIFNLNDDGKYYSYIRNSPAEPIGMVAELLQKYELSGFPRRDPGGKILGSHKDLAAWVQKETENIICKKIDYLINMTGITNVCMSGGVSYNCSSNGKIITRTKATNVYVHPASGDQGQCLGNAIFGYISDGKPWPRVTPFNPYIGGSEEISLFSIKELLKDSSEIKIVKSDDISFSVAKLLAEDHVVAWFQGRSEYGPRALGNRSILANPGNAQNKRILNDIKQREDFMPFAPTILAEKASAYFQIASEIPYMTAAVPAYPEQATIIPGVVHVDGTARVQTLKKDFNPLFYDLISHFYNLTNIPLVLNTSFNGPGMPIVETLKDAINTFLTLDIRFLAIGSFLLEKPAISRSEIVLEAETDKLFEIDLLKKNVVNEQELKSLLQNKFHSIQLVPRRKFLLHEKFITWLKDGRKTTTIRHEKDGIDFPVSTTLPLIPTKDFSKNAAEIPVAMVEIIKYTVKNFKNLNDGDAHNDGFKNLKELRKVLFDIYGPIEDDDYVSIYQVQIAEH